MSWFTGAFDLFSYDVCWFLIGGSGSTDFRLGVYWIFYRSQETYNSAHFHSALLRICE